MTKARAGEDLTPSETEQLRLNFIALFRGFENTHFQHQLGALSSEHIAATRELIKSMVSVKTQRQFWKEAHQEFRSTYVKWVDEIIQEIEQEEAVA